MCTVTLIPLSENNFILTSNRDEASGRKTLLPEFYKEDSVQMLYPKDAMAGGTWIGLSDQNTLVCLLNGGFKNHKRGKNYAHSRGVVVKDLLKSTALEMTLRSYDCTGIEPFTIVAINWSNGLNFFEMVWDGSENHIQELPKIPMIWSSSTLYNPQMKQERKEWFNVFKATHDCTPDTLLDFHKTGGAQQENYDLIMDRGDLKTCSITQVTKLTKELSMRYEDLQSQEVTRVGFTDAITV